MSVIAGLNKWERKLLEWALDPVSFVREALGAEPDEWQIAALNDVRDHDQIAIRSGHGVGKTALLAWIILWWLLTRTPALVACTAPSAHQLENVLWSEIARWRRKMDPDLQALLVVISDKISLATHPDENFAVARTARKENPEALQGFHSQNMLFLIDEASGVEEIIFEVGEGSMSTPGAKTVMTGNPTRTSGKFHRAFHEDRASWRLHHISILDMIRRGVPYVSADYPKRVAQRHGEDSNVYRIRVLGDFPTSEDDVVIPLYLVERAVGRDVQPSGRHVWGVDPARFGDDRTALCKRRGNVVREPVKTWRKKNVAQVAGLVRLEYDEARLKPDEIMIDTIGLGGGVYDILKEQGLPVRAVNVAESAAVKERYVRLRDELWFAGKDWFEQQGCSIADDPELIAELTAVKYEITSAGKFKAESKDDMKARGLRSPDKADAFLITFAAPTTASFWKKLTFKDAAYYV
jgi:hypothetical protein